MPYTYSTTGPAIPYLPTNSPFYGGAGGAGGSGAGTLPGSIPSSWSAAYGGIPGVPNPTGSAGAAIGGNTGNLAALYGMLGSLNQFQTGQANQSLATNLPGYTGMAQQASDNIGNELAGNLPPDVIRNIQQQAAERGIATGSPGSNNANASYLRSLGLDTLGLQQQGNKDLSAAVARTPTAPLLDPNQFLVNAEQQQYAQYMANLLRASPDPAAAAQAAMAALNQGRGSAGGGGGGGGYRSFPSPSQNPGYDFPTSYSSYYDADRSNPTTPDNPDDAWLADLFGEYDPTLWGDQNTGQDTTFMDSGDPFNYDWTGIGSDFGDGMDLSQPSDDYAYLWE